MELIHYHKEHGYFSSELYHLLEKKKLGYRSEEITPSVYKKEMSMTTSERLSTMNAIMVDNIVRKSKIKPKLCLSFTPNIIIFQNFKVNEEYTAKFSIRNTDTSPVFLQLVFKESSYFRITKTTPALLSRLAPGITVTFTLVFSPHAYEDYTHKVTFQTDKDQYVLPIIGVGPRPIFDMPDDITMPKALVKKESSIDDVFITNIGNVRAGLTLKCKCPFSVTPKSICLQPGEKCALKVSFKTMRLGDVTGVIQAFFETGEIFMIKVFGSTFKVSIELEKQTVRFLDTYKTLTRQQVFKIKNNSPHPLMFILMKNQYVIQDFEEKMKFATTYYNLKESEAAKYMKLVEYEILTSDEHDRIYARIFLDEIHSLVADDSISFHNKHFSINPVRGTLWPNSKTELTVNFNPQDVGDFECVAFIDVDGVVDRMPIKMKGISIPPKIKLNIEVLNMHQVYINKNYNYEIIAYNLGEINGVLTHKPQPTLFDSVIACMPKKHCLRPGDKEIFVITFRKPNQGSYFEEVHFTIEDSDVVLKLYLKGTVVFPSLMFSTPCLDFGDVSLGDPKSLTFEVINESAVDVGVVMKIPSDGPVLNSMSLEDFAVNDIPKPKIPPWPKEFTIEPSKFVVAHESRFLVQVTLLANLIRANQTVLELEISKSESNSTGLPVTFNALVPTITPAPDIYVRVCFIDYTYKYEVVFLSNEYRGYFTVADPETQTTLEVKSLVTEGFIEPSSSVCLPIEIRTLHLGRQEFSLRINLFGFSQPVEICHIVALGVRPIVTCTPATLHFGHVKLLTKGMKILTLFNDSPVYVPFKIGLLNRDGNFTISPNEGILEPESETEVNVFVYLVDAAVYNSKAIIQLERVKDIYLPLIAIGVGTSIVIGPLADRIELGRHFTKIPLVSDVVITNHGTKFHALDWNCTHSLPKSMREAVNPFFKLEPNIMKIGAGESLILKVSGMAQKPCDVKETWFLVGSIEGINKKELLCEFPILAEFVDPKIEISKSVLNFRYDYGPYNEYYNLLELVTIKNVSKLPLNIELALRPPFVFIRKQSYTVAPGEEDFCGCVCFQEEDLNIKGLMESVGSEKSKIFIDYLTLKPVDFVKENPLDFFKDINKMKMVFNLTYLIQELMEDDDIIKIQILFDTSKHTTLKSKLYTDLMRIRFQGHKNKDSVKIFGQINFPNLLVMHSKVDFGCILNGTACSKTIQIQNPTPLLVCYKFQWKKIKITVTPPEQPVEEPYSNLYKLSSTTQESIPSNLEENASELQEIVTRNSLMTGSEIKTTVMSEGLATKEGESSEIELSLEEYKIRTLKKIVPMISTEYNPDFEWSHKFVEKQKEERISINDVMLVTPHRGVLRPGDVQNVHVMFNPVDNMKVKGVLECEVLGGPPETVLVMGKSADLIYSLNTRRLNFKIRSFHTPAHEEINITNMSQLPFEFITYYENITKNELKGTILELIPPRKVLQVDDEERIKIAVRPGVRGFFSKDFILEIGHLPYTNIEVFGWGVIPQIYLCLPRPHMELLPVLMGYEAIQMLTMEYLECIDEIFDRRIPEHVNSPLTEKCQEDPTLQQDWHICSSQWDGIPSVMDIELAIERYQVMNYLDSRPDILEHYKNGTRSGPITGFYATPYVMDFGVVITGSIVSKTLEIVNYGPITAKPHFSKNTIVPNCLQIKLMGKINPGEAGKIEVTFNANPEVFTELEQNVEIPLNIEVPYGVTVPLKIRSLCAVPFLATNMKVLDFGSIRCGDKVISAIPLKNVGKPVCIWYTTFKMKVTGENPITILDGSGKYDPGESGWLHIAFKPSMEMLYHGMLIFRFHMNPTRLTIPVVGQGIAPHVHIIGPKISFPPTLPWSQVTDIYFGITNPCPFPIQLIFAHVDEIWPEEDEIYNLLTRYYNKPQEILLPPNVPYDGLPEQIMNFLIDYNKRLQQAREKEAAANKAFLKGSTSKRTKSPVKPSKDKDKNKEPKETPRKIRTDAEIVNDLIAEMNLQNIDPVRDCFVENKEEHSEEPEELQPKTKGVIIILHGSPCEETQCKEMAYTLGINLEIPTINIDIAIIDALCECEGLGSSEIKIILEEMYGHLNKRLPSQHADLNANASDADGNDYLDCMDNFELYQRMIELIATAKAVAPTKKQPSDKKKTTSTRNSATSVPPAGLMFPLELIQDLLTEYFDFPKFKRGFILDSLTSNIIRTPSVVLTTVLRSKQSIHNIHLILCHSDFNKWASAYEEMQKEAEQLEEAPSNEFDENEIQHIIQDFEYMNADEYENSPQELRNIYITFGLEERRKAYYEKIHFTPKVAKDSKRDAKSQLENATGADAKKEKRNPKREEKWKPTSEYILTLSKYNEYMKTTLDSLLNIANNWIIAEQDVGMPLIGFNGAVLGATHKKTKKTTKSEIQVQSTEGLEVDRGFPLTVIMCPCLRFKEALVRMFQMCPIVTEALKVEEEVDIFTLPPMRDEFAVLLPKVKPSLQSDEALELKFLDEKPIRKCECNQAFDIDLLDDDGQEQIYKTFSKWHCECGKKMLSTQTSTTGIPTTSVTRVSVEEDAIYPQPLPLQRVHSLTKPEKRVILQPYDLLRCKYSFDPKTEGSFSVKQYVEINGWPESRTTIMATGICDLPRLDSRPKKMFEKFCRRTVETELYKHTYLNDKKVFEFGPIFAGAERVYAEEIKIEVRNCSLLTAEVEIEFTDNNSVFIIDETFIILEPGCRTKLTLSAAPSEVGEQNTVLLLSIKENPEIVELNIKCTGVDPIVEILPAHKMIDYGKLLLYRRQEDRFIVKNDSVLPVFWKIRDPQLFYEDFLISKTSGIVPRNDNHVVPVTYIACNVGVITNKELVIEIYDEHGRGAPMVVDNLFLSGECYDVLVECAFENTQDSFLNFGNVKVNSIAFKDMFLLNRGKYNLYHKLKKVKNFPEPSILKSMKANPDCGIMPAGQRLVAIEFECTPTTSVNLSNVPAFTCSLLDGSKDQVVVAKFPVCITINSFYNTFTLFPLGELNFHIIAVGTAVLKDVIINNTSKCPILFDIILPDKYQKEHEATLEPLKSKPDPKNKTGLIKLPPMRCGPFIIMQEDNLLPPGTSRTIQIQFSAFGPKRFEETIKFLVSDTCPAEATGVPLRLVGLGAIPTLDFWDLNMTFQEHLILKRKSDYTDFASSPHCVFVENNVSLYFFCVTVNHTHTGNINLYNNGVVPCTLKMTIHQAEHDIFSLHGYSAFIQPLSRKKLGIIFTPTALKDYRAVLEIKIQDQPDVIFQICLIGEGNIPRIEIFKPPITNNKLGLINFPVTCLGSVSVKKVKFKNISMIRSKVSFEITPKFDDELAPNEFSLFVTGNTGKVIGRDNSDTSRYLVILVTPNEVATVAVRFNPAAKGKCGCDLMVRTEDNPYEYFTIFCEGEAFMEDIILTGLEMLSLSAETTLSTPRKDESYGGSVSADARKKSVKSAPPASKKKDQAKKKKSDASLGDQIPISDPVLLKYVLDLGGCELSEMQKRSITMMNNSDKVYKFVWDQMENVIIKPSIGYISPGEEKDFVIMFYSAETIDLNKEPFYCMLSCINDESLVLNVKGMSWDNRQVITKFKADEETGLRQRGEDTIKERINDPMAEIPSRLTLVILIKATVAYTQFKCSLDHDVVMMDTFIYQTRIIDFTLTNTGIVPLKILWQFVIDEEYPVMIDKSRARKGSIEYSNEFMEDMGEDNSSLLTESAVLPENKPVKLDEPSSVLDEDESKLTLFSGSSDRESVDTWFEAELPFSINPCKDCLEPMETRQFQIVFTPQDAFEYRVRLKSQIDNLDPDVRNVSLRISARSLIPYVHLDLEASDYLTRRTIKHQLPLHTQVLEFNVIGTGCYNKTFNIVNPTGNGYEFIFRQPHNDSAPIHCANLKGYVEGASSFLVTFTYTPTALGVCESLWEFLVVKHSVTINLLVVGHVREPEVVFSPRILLLRNSIMGFTTTGTVKLKNLENLNLKYKFIGDSISSAYMKSPITMEPEEGTLKPYSEIGVKLIYDPIQDGPLLFKVFCEIQYMTKPVTFCVNALSFSIKPTVTYSLHGKEHVLQHEAITNIILDQTASTYERVVPFKILNQGSASFHFEWKYETAGVKKYLTVNMEPKSGYLSPGTAVDCELHFTLVKVDVYEYPLTLTISDGPEYNMNLFARIYHPQYHFTSDTVDFGKCFINMAEKDYKKHIAFVNDSEEPLLINLDISYMPEIFIEYTPTLEVRPKERLKFTIYFRPKDIKIYDIKVPYRINSLVHEFLTIKGEGIPLLLDVYEGCQRCYNLGSVKIGDTVTRQIEVMNQSDKLVNVTFEFKNSSLLPIATDETKSDTSSACILPNQAGVSLYTGAERVKTLQSHMTEKTQEHEMENNLAIMCLRSVPTQVTVRAHTKVPVKIKFRPTGFIHNLDVQLYAKVSIYQRPLVRFNGRATGMLLEFNRNSLQFGRVRKYGRKVLKVMLMNKGDFTTRFCWQPLFVSDFKISPMKGTIRAKSNVNFTIIYSPKEENPFVKVWASCNIDDYGTLELAMYATCIEIGVMLNKTLAFEAPVREKLTNHISVTNPSDEVWLIQSESSAPSFGTLRECTVKPYSDFDIPIIFQPETMGTHEGKIFYTGLGDSALFVTVIGAATEPKPNASLFISVVCKEQHTENLKVYCITGVAETYIVCSEVVKIVPDKFTSYYEMNYPESVKVWGEAVATVPWTFVCYAECEMTFRVTFINKANREFQYYDIVATVTPSRIKDVVHITTRARETVTAFVTVVNPVVTPQTFEISCDQITVEPEITIPRKSEAVLQLTYAPLVTGHSEELLQADNLLLGSIYYKLVLECLPAKPKYMECSTPIGTSTPLRMKVENLANTPAVFAASTTNSCIILDRDYSLAANDKAKFRATFEPVDLGDVECTVTFNSPVAGEFVFNLKCTATRPEPQGPIDVHPGGSAAIKFKNVFETNQTYNIYTDREEFYVKSSNETLKSKKDIKILVYMVERPPNNWKTMPTGCLYVETYTAAEEKIQWIYFLRGA